MHSFLLLGFPDTETQMLTNKGWMFLEDVEAYAKIDLKFAGYDENKKQIKYERPNDVIAKPWDNHEMVELTNSREGPRWERGSDEYGRSSMALVKPKNALRNGNAAWEALTHGEWEGTKIVCEEDPERERMGED